MTVRASGASRRSVDKPPTVTKMLTSRADEIPKPVKKAAEKPCETPVLQSRVVVGPGETRKTRTAVKKDRSKVVSSMACLPFFGTFCKRVVLWRFHGFLLELAAWVSVHPELLLEESLRKAASHERHTKKPGSV